MPCVVGYEVAGTIDAVGEGVDLSRLGQRVAALTRFGGYSTVVTVPSAQAVRRPDGMDATIGAAIPVAGLTAWMMCEVMGRVRAGDRVLVHSAGGGVGLMALDLLRWRGATAIGTASARKHAELLERGYSQLIDYTTQDFAQVLAKDEGLDLILDAVGGESWAKDMDLLRAGGRLVMFGMSANAGGDKRRLLSVLGNVAKIPWVRFSPTSIINNNMGLMGVNMGRMWHESARIGEWMGSLFELWEQGHLRPVVHAAVPFDQVAEAHRMLHDRENTGKVVLVT